MSRTMNILLVEDNELDAMVLSRALAKVAPSANILRARDGIEALEILKTPDPALAVPRPFFILLDINMPRMNGHEFLESMRKLDGEAGNVVFMFTTSDSPKDIAMAYQNNVSGYIVKPQDTKGLRDVLGILQGFWSICEFPTASELDLQPL
ncbi:response regulator [Phaeobacter gallaeciensis]|uniref:response regulator n=1 Tax=Phaeobacter gallaeciensis TaxID=60890 RepID=UPI002380AEAE|nr:response regulator [Phaeobacter gallaeciensis]MDE4276805.1 response regulator [Phaeobacter gallaeciensis]MDE4302041.1 response regulator [Phaeobacter gallaeciensis]MDE5187229.1 response regulator [Phaeobacter gallaeciensis]